MADHEHTSDLEHASGHAHVVPPRVYLIVYIILMVLMGLTVLAYYFHPASTTASNVIALTIAVIKAVLVVLFFMQVKYSSKLTWVWAAVGFLWLIILFSTVTDYLTRYWIPIPGWQQGQ